MKMVNVETRKLRLLSVEDNPDDAELLLRELERGGYSVDFSRVDMLESLDEALRTETWDLVTSDFSLPGFTAVEAIRKVRSHSSELPVIIISGTIGEDMAVLAMREGANDYIMKHNLTRL